MFFRDIFVSSVFQDYGHTGKIHNALTIESKHYGMFIFDLGSVHDLYVFHKLFLYCNTYRNTVVKGQSLFQIIPGFFQYPENIFSQDFLTQDSLDACGWVPVEIKDKNGNFSIVSKVIKSGDIIGENTKLELDFVFSFDKQYLGFLIDPYVITDGEFEVSFGDETSQDKNKPLLKVQTKTVSLNISEAGSGSDNTRHLGPNIVGLLDKKDIGKGIDFSKSDLYFINREIGKIDEINKGPNIKGLEKGKNHSSKILSIALTENGKIVEVYGFNGYTERYYYPDYIKVVFEKATIKKLNVITWSGQMVEFPWASLLWYGEIYYFADQEEFGECCNQYFIEHGNDDCPVCGNPLGEQLKYSFIDVTRIPHQLYFCSKECLRAFNSKMTLYLKFLTKSNIEYLTTLDF